MKAFAPFLLLSCSLMPAMGGVNAKEPSASYEMNHKNMVTEYVLPTKVVWTSDSSGNNIKNPNNLMKYFSGQVSVADESFTTLYSTSQKPAAILLDFGKELHGGIEIASAIRKSQVPISLRVRLGESVTEAMSDINPSNGASNDHAIRDYIVKVPWLGTLNIGNSGFRFVRIDLIDTDVEYNLRSVRATSIYKNIPYIGSFNSDNKRLNQIWKTGAYTVHLNMQDYLWDGIKRDRLVWIGDLHPEVMTVNTVFGQNDVVNKSLDFARDDTPLPGWMNGMCSYSLWWIIIQRDLYLYQGNLAYLKEQHTYLRNLLKQVCSKIDKNGVETLDGTRFLDWPTSRNNDVINTGLHSMCYMAVNAGIEMGKILGDEYIVKICNEAATNLKKQNHKAHNNKEAAAMKIFSNLSNDKKDCDVILKDGANRFSTFYGYYMLEALAKCGKYDDAVDIISKYWGAMLDLGATTFWEELNYEDVGKSSRIDMLVPDGSYDIHADGGDFCYKGLRMSLCHGWASGPTAWLTKYILGVMPKDAGCSTIIIEPHLSGCNEVSGTFPTPKGIVTIKHRKDSNSLKILSVISAPIGIKVELKGAVIESLTYTN